MTKGSMSTTAASRREPVLRRFSRGFMSLAAALGYELLFQWRQGFIFVYGIVTLAYIGLALILPEALYPYVLPIMLYTDPSILGFIFVGGGIMLERDQGTLQGVRITPRSLDLFILRKGAAYSLVATLMVVLISVAAIGYVPWAAVVGTFLGCYLFTNLGVVVASASRDINSFFILGASVMLPQALPMVGAFLKNVPWVAHLYPGYGLFRTVLTSVRPVSLAEIGLALGSTAIYAVLGFLWARRALDNAVIRLTGGE